MSYWRIYVVDLVVAHGGIAASAAGIVVVVLVFVAHGHADFGKLSRTRMQLYSMQSLVMEFGFELEALVGSAARETYHSSELR